MTHGSRLTAHGAWVRRQKRAKRLRSDHPHAAELLAFYEHLVAIQEPVFVKAHRSRWLNSVKAPAARGDDAPLVHLDRLPARPRERAFMAFVKSLPESSTDVLHAIAARLAAEPAVARRLLETFLAGHAIDEIAVALDCAAPPLEFFPRAFVQPIAEALVQRAANGHPDEDAGDAQTSCPHCAAPPLVSIIRDEPEIKGRRTLLCSLCAGEWTFPRLCCPNCCERQPQALQYHATDFWPHVRVEECSSCRTYLKAIDLRENGLAVPEVDEIASVELDLWASEQGMAKLQKNVLGL